MNRRTHFARSQRMTIAAGILFIVILIIILQLWLFVATVNAFLGGDTAVLLPAALNLGLLWYLYALER